jgi:hypothetical protein
MEFHLVENMDEVIKVAMDHVPAATPAPVDVKGDLSTPGLTH